MTIARLLKTSGFAALAAAMVVAALPAPTWARDNDNRTNASSRPGDRGGSDRGARQQQRQGWANSQRDSARPDNPRRQPQPRTERAEQRAERPQPSANSNYRPAPAPRPPSQAGASGRDNYRPDRDRVRPDRPGSARAPNRAPVAGRPGGAPPPQGTVGYQNRDRDRDQARDRDRWNQNGRQWRDNDRNRSYRDNDRNRSYRDNDRNRSYQGRDRDHRQWDHRWRDNHRYDWRGYRNSHRSTFRVGIYYAPYRNYYYRRLDTGFFLDALFYSNRYWINDPWQYRLPAAYGPYRWVHYYDDALLVDTYSGEVVDVIYDFFW